MNEIAKNIPSITDEVSLRSSLERLRVLSSMNIEEFGQQEQAEKEALNKAISDAWDKLALHIENTVLLELKGEYEVIVDKFEADAHTLLEEHRQEVATSTSFNQPSITLATETPPQANPTTPENNQAPEEEDERLIKKMRKKSTVGGKAAMIAGGAALVGAVYWIGKKIKNLFTSSEENKEEGKKGGSWWKRLLGAVGIGGLLIRKGEDITEWFAKVFGIDNAEKKKDDQFQELVKVLGGGWKYDAGTNMLYYGHYFRKIEELVKDQTIVLNDKGIDIEKSKVNLQKIISGDDLPAPNGNNTQHVEKTQESQEAHERMPLYDTLVPVINQYYMHGQYKLGDATETYEVTGADHKESPGFIIAHLDLVYPQIRLLLNEKTTTTLINASTEDVLEMWGKLPATTLTPLLEGLQRLMGGIPIISTMSEGMADGRTSINRMIANMNPEHSKIIEQYTHAIVVKEHAVLLYLIDVRKTYSEKVAHDPQLMKEFDESNIYQLLTLQEYNPSLKASLATPELNRDLKKDNENVNKDEWKRLEALAQANDAEKRELAGEMLKEIDETGFHEWTVLRDVFWGHIFETDAYVDMRIIEEMYGEIFAGWRGQLKALVKADPWEAHHTETFKTIISDYHNTMRDIKNLSQVRQVTDEDGSLYTLWQFPVWTAYKKIYQTVMLNIQDGNVLSLALVTLGTVGLTGLPKGWKLWKKSSRVFRPPVVLAFNKIVGEGITLTGRGLNKIFYKPRYYQSLMKRYGDGVFERLLAHDLISGKVVHNTQSLSDLKTLYNNIKKTYITDDVKLFEKILGVSEDNAKKLLAMWKNNPTDLAGVFKQRSQRLGVLRGLGKKYDRLRGIHRSLLNNTVSYQLDTEALRRFTTGSPHVTGSPANNLSPTPGTPEVKSMSLDDYQKAFQKSEAELKTMCDKLVADMQKEIAEEAKKIKAKSGTDAYKGAYDALVKKIEEKYHTVDFQKLLTQHNDEIVVPMERALLADFNKKNRLQKQQLYTDNPFLKKIVDANGGIQAWKLPGKYGRLISVGVHSLMLGWYGSEDNPDGTKKSFFQSGTDAADFGIGMIPFAGGVYDMGMAIRGVDLSGNKMTTTDRWIRGGIGLGTGVLDVFTFGIGGTVIRGLAKGGMKLAAKSVAKEATEAVASGVVKKVAISTGGNILMGSAVGLALIQGGKMIKQVPLDDVAVVDIKKNSPAPMAKAA